MMRISKAALRKMVEEELALILDANPNHDPKTGKFSKGNSGDVYSLTKNATDDVSNLEAPARGTVTAKGKVSSKFGMNGPGDEKACGRLNINGDEKKRTRSCSQYPKLYSQTRSVAEDMSGAKPSPLAQHDIIYIKQLIKNEVERAVKAQLVSMKKAGSSKQRQTGCSWNTLMGAIQDIETAQKGHKEK
jgi:hypothetical protein